MIENLARGNYKLNLDQEVETLKIKFKVKFKKKVLIKDKILTIIVMALKH